MPSANTFPQDPSHTKFKFTQEDLEVMNSYDLGTYWQADDKKRQVMQRYDVRGSHGIPRRFLEPLAENSEFISPLGVGYKNGDRWVNYQGGLVVKQLLPLDPHESVMFRLCINPQTRQTAYSQSWKPLEEGWVWGTLETREAVSQVNEVYASGLEGPYAQFLLEQLACEWCSLYEGQKGRSFMDKLLLPVFIDVLEKRIISPTNQTLVYLAQVFDHYFTRKMHAPEAIREDVIRFAYEFLMYGVDACEGGYKVGYLSRLSHVWVCVYGNEYDTSFLDRKLMPYFIEVMRNSLITKEGRLLDNLQRITVANKSNNVVDETKRLHFVEFSTRASMLCVELISNESLRKTYLKTIIYIWKQAYLERGSLVEPFNNWFIPFFIHLFEKDQIDDWGLIRTELIGEVLPQVHTFSQEKGNQELRKQCQTLAREINFYFRRRLKNFGDLDAWFILLDYIRSEKILRSKSETADEEIDDLKKFLIAHVPDFTAFTDDIVAQDARFEEILRKLEGALDKLEGALDKNEEFSGKSKEIGVPDSRETDLYLWTIRKLNDDLITLWESIKFLKSEGKLTLSEKLRRFWNIYANKYRADIILRLDHGDFQNDELAKSWVREYQHLDSWGFLLRSLQLLEKLPEKKREASVEKTIRDLRFFLKKNVPDVSGYSKILDEEDAGSGFVGLWAIMKWLMANKNEEKGEVVRKICQDHAYQYVFRVVAELQQTDQDDYLLVKEMFQRAYGTLRSSKESKQQASCVLVLHLLAQWSRHASFANLPGVGGEVKKQLETVAKLGQIIEKCYEPYLASHRKELLALLVGKKAASLATSEEMKLFGYLNAFIENEHSISSYWKTLQIELLNAQHKARGTVQRLATVADKLWEGQLKRLTGPGELTRENRLIWEGDIKRINLLFAHAIQWHDHDIANIHKLLAPLTRHFQSRLAKKLGVLYRESKELVDTVHTLSENIDTTTKQIEVQSRALKGLAKGRKAAAQRKKLITDQRNLEQKKKTLIRRKEPLLEARSKKLEEILEVLELVIKVIQETYTVDKDKARNIFNDVVAPYLKYFLSKLEPDSPEYLSCILVLLDAMIELLGVGRDKELKSLKKIYDNNFKGYLDAFQEVVMKKKPLPYAELTKIAGTLFPFNDEFAGLIYNKSKDWLMLKVQTLKKELSTDDEAQNIENMKELSDLLLSVYTRDPDYCFNVYNQDLVRTISRRAGREIEFTQNKDNTYTVRTLGVQAGHSPVYTLEEYKILMQVKTILGSWPKAPTIYTMALTKLIGYYLDQIIEQKMKEQKLWGEITDYFYGSIEEDEGAPDDCIVA